MQHVQTGSCLLVAVRSLCTKKARGGAGAPLLQYRGGGGQGPGEVPGTSLGFLGSPLEKGQSQVGSRN